MQYGFYLQKKDFEFIKKVENYLNLRDKYDNPIFQSKSEIIIYMLRIGVYQFENEHEIKKKYEFE